MYDAIYFLWIKSKKYEIDPIGNFFEEIEVTTMIQIALNVLLWFDEKENSIPNW
ncbi:hypothetical protein McpSp1_04630 [Methanocorpusculaceae archaeon Sp1]|nr:hypothetical protein [Methanocorpusculaceae archaeon Sp1]